MKIAPNAASSFTKKAHVLPLVPEKDAKKTQDNSVVFQLRIDPGELTSPTYKMAILILRGDESVRSILKWMEDSQKILTGLNVTTGPNQYDALIGTMDGTAKALFSARAHDLGQEALEVAVRAAADAGAATAARAHGWKHYLTPDIVVQARRHVVEGLVPKKALATAKRQMRRHMRKGADMKIRAFYQHLMRINGTELPLLPPFANDQSLGADEIIDILLHAVPNSWEREMDLQGFDPLDHTPAEVVDFMEQVELAEPQPANNNDDKKQKASTNNVSKKQKSSNNQKSGGTKYCEIHGQCSHTTAECRSKQQKYGNKTWDRKTAEKVNANKKELAAFIKKQVAKGIRDMSSVDKKRSADTDSEGEDLNAFDIKEFNYGLQIDSDDEMSC
jgi:hypothetical protein